MTGRLRILIVEANLRIQEEFFQILSSSQVHQWGKQANFEAARDESDAVKKVDQAAQAGSPFALVFVNLTADLTDDHIQMIRQLWALDKDLQIILYVKKSMSRWEETLQNCYQHDNLVLLKNPSDPFTLRQLVSTLCKKWLLATDARHLEHQASHDALTDLPNRLLFQDRTAQAIAQASRHQEGFAMMFMDLDRFKLVNDSLSHAIGDALLQAVATRLSSLLRKVDTLARVGGDEFVMIIPELNQEGAVVNVAQKILNAFEDPFTLSNHQLSIKPSIGISIYPDDGTSISTLLRHADLAMYHAKEQGGNQFKFYTPSLNQHSKHKLTREIALRKALQNKEFYLVYQPQFDLNTKEVLSVEALIRWQHPMLGEILPLDFIPTAEESGLIMPLGEWVLEQVCQQMNTWKKHGLAPLRISVNISNHQLQQANFDKNIQKILKKHHVKPSNLELELTKNAIITHPEIITPLQALKDLGLTIVLDNFDMNNTQASQLKQKPIDRLKINRAFIKNISKIRSDEVMIETIMSLAQKLGFQVVADGVETADQMAFLESLQCFGVQGFLLSKPLSPEGVESYMNTRSTRSSH